MKHLSYAANNVLGQPMFKMLDKVQKLERSGAEILHFELGEPDFETPCNIVDAACNALKNGHTHYVSSMGLHEFREVIRDATFNSRGFKPDLDQVLITPGANAIIYLAVSCLVNPGDEVIIPNPGFPTYESAINFVGAKAAHVPLYEKNLFRLNPEDLESRITSKTRLIIINSPSNPTGAAMTPEEINQVAEIARKHDIYLLSDEIYGRMLFDNKNHFHCPGSLDKCRDRTIIINGFSKAFAMTGWRLGVAIGPKDVIEKMGLVVQTIVSCVPPFIQIAGIEAINGDQESVLNMMSAYNKRRDTLVDGLNDIPGISCIRPEGALYAFPNIQKTGMTSEEFADFALNKAGIALLPGNNFGVYGEGFVRICYVNSLENIEIAIRRLKKSIEELNG